MSELETFIRDILKAIPGAFLARSSDTEIFFDLSKIDGSEGLRLNHKEYHLHFWVEGSSVKTDFTTRECLKFAGIDVSRESEGRHNVQLIMGNKWQAMNLYYSIMLDDQKLTVFGSVSDC